MLSIGEFSKTTSLTVKALRYYHDLGILMPGKIDDFTGYRYYSREALFRADAILILKELGFSLNEIISILKDCSDDQELSAYLEKKISDVEKKITDLKSTRKKLELYKSNIATEAIVPSDIKKGVFAETWICGIRYKGKYSDFGKYFSKLMKKTGRFIKGKALGFCYDLEYKEEDADIEVCVATRKKIEVPEINCRLFPETPCISIVHKGPYGTQGPSYMKLFDYCSRKDYKQIAPIIERYIKGPGFIFTGNPENYLTELIILLQE
jgi:DNA-binding transcriptional MerR regulator/effector-binding domain-containing protein